MLQTGAAVRFGVRNSFGINGVLFDVRKQEHDGSETAGFGAVVNVRGTAEQRARRRQTVVRVVIVLDGETELLEVVGALHTTSRFTRRLDGGEKETDQNADDRDNDQQFNQGEALAILGGSKHCWILVLLSGIIWI